MPPLDLRCAAIGEITVGTFFFDFAVPASDVAYRQDPVFWTNTLAKIAVVAFVLLVIAVWPRRDEIAGLHRRAATHGTFKRYLVLNAALFGTLLVSRYFLALMGEPSLSARAVYSILPLATGASLAFLAAPPAFWGRLPKLPRPKLPLRWHGQALPSFLADKAGMPCRAARSPGHTGY